MNFYTDSLIKIVHFLSKIEQEYTVELEKLVQEAPGNLICSNNKKGIRFSRALCCEDGYERRGITREPEAIAALCRKKYVEAVISQIRENMNALETAAGKYREFNFDMWKKSLSKAYQMQPDEYFFAKEDETDSLLWPMEYVQSDYKPEGKTNITSRGLRVRSKGEVAIAEMLYRYNIPFRYEQVLTIEKYNVAPDFTLMGRDGELRYWEHCGLTNNKKYMDHHKWKMGLYESVGIVPWKNLIVTYDEEDGTINMQIIESEIRNKLL